MEEYLACLALRHTAFLGPKAWKRLLAHFGSARAAVDQASRWPSLQLVNERQWRSFRARGFIDAVEAERREAADKRHKVVLWTDPHYPPLLREIPDPPLFLYYAGHLELAKGPCLAVVGSRTCSAYGLSAARKIAGELSEAGLTVVSGMAWGIDRQAHLASLEGPGSSIGVLGTGLDQIYPPENKDVYLDLSSKGLVLTEYAPGTRPIGSNFPRRNRIISGISLGVLLVEAPLKSGGRITTSQALDQNREVYVVAGPEGRETFAGCRELMDQGARAVTSAGEIILDLAPLLREEIRARGFSIGAVDAEQLLYLDAEPPLPHNSTAPEPDPRPLPADLSGDELTVIRAINENADASVEGVHIDVLGRALGWTSGKVSHVLLSLEIQGFVIQLPGMRYGSRI